MNFVSLRRAPEAPELQALQAALTEAQRELDCAYRRFDCAVDPELVESCCYEISAAKARCSYLLRRIKEESAAGKGEAWL